MRRKHTLLFAIPALVLCLLLCYSLYQALRLYIPMWQEEQAFDALKNSIQVATLDVSAPVSADNDHTTPGVRATLQADVTDGQPERLSPFNTASNKDHAELRQAPDAMDEVHVSESPEPTPNGTPYATEQAQYQYGMLTQVNRDFVGWLTIDDTEIDYPVMKSAEDDPQYYLHRNFYGEYSYSGCLFIGSGCDAESDAFIIYGHNMNNGSMFGLLDRYADYNYAIEHSRICLYMPDGVRVYRVFAAFQTKVYHDRDDVFKYYDKIGSLEQADYEQTVESIRRMSSPSLPYAPTWPAQLVFLSTCSYHTEDGRFVVAAYRL